VSYCVYWIFITIALIIMRVDERRVARGQATLWRAMLGKGPRPTGREGTAFVHVAEDEADGTLKNLPTGAERDLRNLTV
jgi:hypothetical protein